MIDAILTNTLLPKISEELLTRTMEGHPATRIAVTAPSGDFQYAFE
jgi:type VI secretion system protein VasG